MDTIRDYLDNMFIGLPNSNKVRRAKEELQAMMEDKYYELKAEGKTENEAIGIVISEFGNLEEISEALGIHAETIEKEDLLRVDLETVQQFYEANMKIWPMTGMGAFFCIMAVSSIFVMMGLSQFGIIAINEDQAAIIGVVGMFVMVAIGVMFFIRYTTQLSNFEDLQKEKLQLVYDARQFVMDKKRKDSNKFKSALSLSVPLFILAVVPVILMGGFFEQENEGYVFFALILMFLMIAFGVFNLVRAYGYLYVPKVLLQEGEYSIKQKEASKSLNKLESVYWLIVLLIYLGWSFTSHNWGITWIVWPIAGILYQIIEVILGGD